MVYTLSFLVNTDTEEVSNLLVVDMDESIHVHVYVCVCVRVWVHMPFLLQGKIFSETGFRLLKENENCNILFCAACEVVFEFAGLNI